MRIVYLGSPKEAVIPLQELLNQQSEWGIEVVGVVSQPARPSGRNRGLVDPPVAAFAKQQGLPVLQPEKARAPEFLEQFRALHPDVAITAAYGQILSDEFLAIPRRATINIHPSLLPKYRGATPVPAALLAGDRVTGVTILFTIKELDAGNIISQQKAEILSGETADQLTERMFALGGKLLKDSLHQLRDPPFKGFTQDPAQVSFCKKIKKDDGHIQWSAPADEVLNRFRAYFPWPGSFTKAGDKPLVITAMSSASADAPSLRPGEFTYFKPLRALLVGTGTQPILIQKLIPAGSKEQDAAGFWNGFGQRLEPKFFGTVQ